jgi:predicted AAA+ superfamily ATPase
MYNRLVISALVNWSNQTKRKPLVLRGARQVGKTSAVQIFSSNFEQYLYFNLEKWEEKQLFESNFSFSDILLSLFLYTNKHRYGYRTLIFIDEIQNSSKAVALLRYFFEEAPDLYIITAGSLLETYIDSHISFPVGRVEYMAIRPCSFVDFLEACNEDKAKKILESESVPAFAHNHLQKLFYTYTLIGGMPEIVAKYAETRDITSLQSIYDSLILSYTDDVEKYVKKSQAIQFVRHIINTAFPLSGERITFERFGNSVYRSRDMKEAFTLLEKTMILKLVYPTGSNSFPLISDLKKKPRLHTLDTGLVNYLARTQLEFITSSQIEDVYRGRISEHIVGQELLAYNYSALAQLQFWVRDKQGSDAEVDYLYPFNGMVIPIEVKSGSGGRLRSLHQFIEQSAHPFAVRIWSSPMKIQIEKTISGKPFRLLNLPFYMISRLDKELENFIKLELF